MIIAEKARLQPSAGGKDTGFIGLARHFALNFGPRTSVFAKFVKNDAAAAICRQFPIKSLFSTESLTNSLPSHQLAGPPPAD
jgi:hypothetical protein